jgi:preprotein translocase subunit SecF
MEFFKKTPTVDFMGRRKWAYVASFVLIVGSFTLLATRGLNLGIDFTGGIVLEANYPETVDIERARRALGEAGFPEAVLQVIGTSRDLMIRLPPAGGDDPSAASIRMQEITNRVQDALRVADPGAKIVRQEILDSQVGRDLTEQGGLAFLFTFIGIMLYVGFRFEKKMAFGTVFGAIHDPVAILGFFAATQLTFDLAVLAAVLAVIGYSINDTVVVFDRVREVFLSMRKGTPKEVMNAGLNQTLSRTMMTSFSVLFVVVSLYLVGGSALHGFSLAIIVGVLVGTYSSIFIAAALALDMKLTAQDLMPVKKEDEELDALP